VIGRPALQLAPASMALVFLNAKRGVSLGTAHTVRLCQRRNLPVFHQEDWLSHPNAGQSLPVSNLSHRHEHDVTLERSRQNLQPHLLQAS
jgi:hypothetical protein